MSDSVACVADSFPQINLANRLLVIHQMGEASQRVAVPVYEFARHLEAAAEIRFGISTGAIREDSGRASSSARKFVAWVLVKMGATSSEVSDIYGRAYHTVYGWARDFDDAFLGDRRFRAAACGALNDLYDAGWLIMENRL